MLKYISILLLLICLLIVSCSTKKSNPVKTDLSIKIDLNTTYDYPRQGSTVLYPLSVMVDSLHSKIKFPDLSGISDTTFAYIYFTGKNHAGIDKGILMLVGDHASKSPLIWVDYNNDLNFSDAKKPLRFSKNFIDVSIPNTDEPKLIHTIRFHKPDLTRKAEIKKMLELYILKGEKYTDFFMDETRNIKVGDFVYKGDSLRIGMMDWDINGSYNDWGTDRVVIGTYKDNINGTEEVDGAVLLDSITYFQVGTHAFEVMKLTDNGTSILIRPTMIDKIKDRIKKGDTIPDYAFELVEGLPAGKAGKKTSVYDHLDVRPDDRVGRGKKLLYLNFWASWCSGCRQEVDDLKRIYSDHSDKVTIVSLNYNEAAGKLKPFLEKYGIQWLNGYSTTQINEELFIQGLPRNILIDPSGRIVEMDIHPSVLLNRMNEF